MIASVHIMKLNIIVISVSALILIFISATACSENRDAASRSEIDDDGNEVFAYSAVRGRVHVCMPVRNRARNHLGVRNPRVRPRNTNLRQRINGRGFVYIIREDAGNQPTGYFKVGRSVRPSARKRNLQTGNPRRLVFHCTVNGVVNSYFRVNDMVAAERLAKNAITNHQSFQWSRLALGGGTEWFRAEADGRGGFVSPCGVVQNAVVNSKNTV